MSNKIVTGQSLRKTDASSYERAKAALVKTGDKKPELIIGKEAGELTMSEVALRILSL